MSPETRVWRQKTFVLSWNVEAVAACKGRWFWPLLRRCMQDRVRGGWKPFWGSIKKPRRYLTSARDLGNIITQPVGQMDLNPELTCDFLDLRLPRSKNITKKWHLPSWHVIVTYGRTDVRTHGRRWYYRSQRPSVERPINHLETGIELEFLPKIH